jgi:hypothetical protein
LLAVNRDDDAFDVLEFVVAAVDADAGGSLLSPGRFFYRWKRGVSGLRTLRETIKT